MKRFRYQARDELGNLRKGYLEAESLVQASRELKARGLFPVSLSPIKQINISFRLLEALGRISNKDLSVFSLQLATMIKVGSPVITGVDAISQQMGNRKFKKILNNVKTDLANGLIFSKALGKYPRIFPEIFRNMVRAGEESGNLELVLERYSRFLENKEQIRSQITTALTYPTILTVLSIVVMSFLIIYVIPKYADIISKAGVELPAPTKIILKIGHIFQTYYLYLASGLLVVVVLMVRYIHTNRGRMQWDRLKIRLPLVGTVISKTAISRLTRTMSTLLGSGIPFLNNLKLVTDVVGNKVIQQRLEEMQKNIERGEGIAKQFQASTLFPAMVVQMIAIGEATGALDQMLDKIADFYDQDVAYSIKKLTTALEPILMIGMALMVGLIALSLVTAIMKTVTSIR